jgi:hypothetical protein
VTMCTPRCPRRATGRWLTVRLTTAWIAVLVPGTVFGQPMPPSLVQFLQETVGLKPDEMTSVSHNLPVVKLLETSDRREVALVGVQGIDVPRALYVQLATNFPTSLREPSRVAMGLFSDPAAPTDVATFALPHDDVQALAQCRPGKCDLKLPARAIGELRAILDPASPSADSVASAYFARHMVEYVTAYRARGNSALVVYDDASDSTAAAQVWDGFLSRSPYIYRHAPTLDRFFRNYPNDRPPDAREALFWAEDDLPGLKPLLTITDEIVYPAPELPGTTFIASKQLYCDHFLDGALDLIAVVDRVASPAPDSAGIYVVLLRRLHFDDLPSGGLVNVRGKVIGKTRDRTLAFLRDTKKASEQAYATHATTTR